MSLRALCMNVHACAFYLSVRKQGNETPGGSLAYGYVRALEVLSQSQKANCSFAEVFARSSRVWRLWNANTRTVGAYTCIFARPAAVASATKVRVGWGRRTNRMYSRSDGTLRTSTPLGNFSLASAVERAGSTYRHTRTRVLHVHHWAKRTLFVVLQVGMCTIGSNVSHGNAQERTMHLSPCFQLAGVARLCDAVSCSESSTRRTCVVK